MRLSEIMARFLSSYMNKVSSSSNELQQKQKPLSDFSSQAKEKVLEILESSSSGLLDVEAHRRLSQYGHNVLVQERKNSSLREFFSKFKSPLIILLIFAAVVEGWFGEMVTAYIIVVMILLSAFLDFLEEHNAGKTAKALLERVRSTAMVKRGEKEKEVHTSVIVPGDILVLNSGDLVPADARIISETDFFVNQSSLTGESEPAKKTSLPLSVSDKSLVDFENMVFAGSNVISGTAEAVVIRTGSTTEFGKIAHTISTSSEKSEFEIGITNFGLLIMKIMLFLVMFIFLFNSIIEHKILESFLFAVAVAVGVTPEMLPMIMSINMAQGAKRMSKKGVIVKRLSAIPTFGGLEVLCTDKTGTLTEGKIALVKNIDLFGEDSDKVLRLAYLNSYFQSGIENSLDEAVLEYRELDMEKSVKVDEIPFDFVRKRLSIIADIGDERLLVSKGAPEEIFSCCREYCHGDDFGDLNDEVRDKAWSVYRRLSSEGYRVLAVAFKKVTRDRDDYIKEDEEDLILCGFIGFMDPPKKDASEAIKSLMEAGVEIKVITGDNELVANKTCREIGLPIKGMLLGNDVDALTDEALRFRVKRTTIFARFSPDQKSRVIMALKANNTLVGYVGDGINDAPSLKIADVGISVNNAVDVAKESADIILTKKNLRVLKEGVIEGRKVFGNTMKYIKMALSSNFGNMFSAAGAVVFLPFLPMLPIQILLNNFLYDLSQITIPMDNVDEDLVKTPHRWDIGYIKRFMFTFGPLSSLFDFATFFILYYVFRLGEASFQTGWFLESLATQVLVIHVIRTCKMPFVQSRPNKYLVISTLGFLALGWLIPFTFLGKFFGLVVLPWYVIVSIIGIVLIYLSAVELGKRYFYKKNSA